MPGAGQRDRSRGPIDPGAITEVLRRRPPAWEGEPPEAPGRARRRASARGGAPEPEPAPQPGDGDWETPPLWDDADAPTRRLPREEPRDDGPDGAPPGHERLF
jgi:hypothetical protein